MIAYPSARMNGGWSISPDGTRRDTWATRCADCNTSFVENEPDEAQRMWWEHVRDEHPNAWAVLRKDAPQDVVT